MEVEVSMAAAGFMVVAVDADLRRQNEQENRMIMENDSCALRTPK